MSDGLPPGRAIRGVPHVAADAGGSKAQHWRWSPTAHGELQASGGTSSSEIVAEDVRRLVQRWGAAVAIGRPSVAARLHAAERALADPDPAVRDQAIREAAEIVQAAYREVVGG